MTFDKAISKFVKYACNVQSILIKRGYGPDVVVKMSTVMYCYGMNYTPAQCVDILEVTIKQQRS